MYEPGIRVGAISHSKDDVVYMFGWGTYEGDFPRRSGPGFGGEANVQVAQAAEVFKEHCPWATEEDVEAFLDRATKNPRIRLDNGKTVWGAQCWWGTEEAVKQRIQGRQVVYLDIDEQVEKARKA